MTGRGWIGVEDVEAETEDTVPDDGLTDTCVECGMTNGECMGDCLYAN